MRRWNGWGDDSVEYPVPSAARQFLETLVGTATPPQDISRDQILKSVPESRLPAHPLVTIDPLQRLLHTFGQSLPDWVAMHSGQINAFSDGVAYPADENEIRQLLQFTEQCEAALIPYGGGTSVTGHITPLPGSQPVLTVDMGRMNRLIHFDPQSRLATFGAGVNGPDLEAQLRARGCTLGHFPQSFEYSTLGGWVATRSSGQQSLRYGRIEKLFAGGRLISPSGCLELPPFPASAAGPDLRELVLGSEGRLGILSEATVRASALPEKEEFHAIFFPDFERGCEAVRQMLSAGLPLAMLRMSTAVETTTSLALAGHEVLIGALEKLLALRGLGSQKCMLLLGFSGPNSLVRSTRGEAMSLASRQGGVAVGRTFGEQWIKNRFRTPYLRNTLWERGYGIDTLETATSWSQVPAMLNGIEQALNTALTEIGERVHVFTHLSHLYPYGSSIYTTYLFRLAAEPQETLQRWHRLKSAASQVIVDMGGTISHQHGVGLDHLPYLPAEKGELGMQVLQNIINSFDPQGIMNPGKLIH
jgi:alkyldihydroxyacetonephosphate synthase